jgi:hypothetical protein
MPGLYCRPALLLAFALGLASATAYAQCSNSDQCKGNRICVNGSCVERQSVPAAFPSTPAPAEQKQCKKDTECPGDEICQNGVCMKPGQNEPTPPPRPAAPAPTASHQCSKDTECPGDAICQNGVCVKPGQNEPTPSFQPAAPSQAPSASVNQPAATASEQPATPPAAASHKSTVSLGPIAGLNLNWGGGDGYDKILSASSASSETYWGFRFGLGLNIRVASFVAIEPRVFFDQKGAAISSGGNSTILRLSYLSIPLVSQWYLAPNSPVSPFIGVGPLFSFNLSSSGDAGGQSTDLGKYTESFFFGILTGAGLSINTGAGYLIVGAGYTWDITQVFKDTFQKDVYLKSLNVEIGYQFAL